MNLNNYFVIYKNSTICLDDLVKYINIGDTVCNVPLNIKILNSFIKKIRINLKNNTISYSLYDNEIRIFGDMKK